MKKYLLIIMTVALLAAACQTQPPAQQVNTPTTGGQQQYSGRFETNFEGYITKFTYGFEYSPDLLNVSTQGNKVVLSGKAGQTLGTIWLYSNDAIGGSSAQDFWDIIHLCEGCQKIPAPVQIQNAKEVLGFARGSEQWVIFPTNHSDYVIVSMQKDNTAVREAVETLAVTSELVPPPGTTTTIKVYFPPKEGEQLECKDVRVAERTIMKTPKVATAALEELLKGPTAEEKAKGFITAIPTGSKLNSLVIVDGQARADFNAVTESGGGSCGMSIRTTQIRQTLLQFPTVKSVVLSINGKTDGIFQP